MHFFKQILKIVFILKLTNGDLVICDNNECRRAEVITTDSLFTQLNAIIEGNRNTTAFLEELNGRIEHKISELQAEIVTIKEVLREQRAETSVASEAGNENYGLYDNLWIVVQRRRDGSVDFYRNWTEYKNGFGNDLGEFFIGLDKIHELTNDRAHELLIILEDFDGGLKFAHYDEFLIGNETERYRLKKLGKYGGTAGDHLRLHLNMFFSTVDRDNDVADEGSCAEWYKGAWWYYHCLTSNLNGPYRHSRLISGNERGIGITWGTYDQIQVSYKSAQMMLRSK